MTDRNFLIEGFTTGFDIGYAGPRVRKSKSENIPLTVGTKSDLWEKITKEIDAGRVAGPFNQIPYENYIQSPIGLVPKAGGKTRMIFHLSYNFSDREQDGSLNAWTPREICTVHYNDLDAVIRKCLNLLKEVETLCASGCLTKDDIAKLAKPVIYLGKTDLTSALGCYPLR